MVWVQQWKAFFINIYELSAGLSWLTASRTQPSMSSFCICKLNWTRTQRIHRCKYHEIVRSTEHLNPRHTLMLFLHHADVSWKNLIARKKICILVHSLKTTPSAYPSSCNHSNNTTRIVGIVAFFTAKFASVFISLPPLHSPPCLGRLLSRQKWWQTPSHNRTCNFCILYDIIQNYRCFLCFPKGIRFHGTGENLI